jgi:hypothetical protein
MTAIRRVLCVARESDRRAEGIIDPLPGALPALECESDATQIDG